MSRQWDGPFPPPSRPIRVEGGIRARTARGAIGRTWWSKRFLAVLESFALGTRLTRGRSYARAGQVLSLTVAPGRVTSVVQGSRRRPYQVVVELAPLPASVWARVEASLAEQAIYSARLLAGEMPPDIEEVFTTAGASLFPRRLADLSLSCSCPDVAVPCKHLAATFYLLAEAFDADPFQILHWRGRDRETLLARLRELRGGGTRRHAPPATDAGHGTADPGAGPGTVGAAPGATGAAPAAAIGAAAALADVTSPPLAEALDRFWLAPVPLPARRPPTLATEPDLLLRQLPPPGPQLGGPALRERLREAYLRLAPSAEG